MQPAINEIAAKQASPTEQTCSACKMLLDYASTYPSAKIHYMASGMVFTVDMDGYAGYLYLVDGSSSPTPNGLVLVICRTLRGVMRSAAEAECAGVFHNSQKAIILRNSINSIASTA